MYSGFQLGCRNISSHTKEIGIYVVTGGISEPSQVPVCVCVCHSVCVSVLPVQAMLMGLSMYCCLNTIPAALALASVFSCIFPFSPVDGGIK